MNPIWTGAAALLLALVHLEVHRLSLAGRIPRSRWLSAAGGISVAYVFLHLLPEVAALEGHLSGGETGAASPAAEGSGGSADGGGGFAEALAYSLALAGFAVFYGLERLAHRSRATAEEDATEAGVFWLHMASFGLYNLIIGYLLTREGENPERLVWYTLAMALHFVVNDAGLREHHARRYHAVGRWTLAAAVLLGWVAAQVLEVGEAALGVVVAFLAGGVMLNVIKEELPEDRESSFPAFALGAAGYAALLLVL